MITEQSTDPIPARCADQCAELVAIMQEQERICLRLLELSASEQVAMLDGRVGELEGSTREKNSLIEQMDRLEQLRREIAGQLARDVGLPDEASLMALAARLSGEDAQRLLEVRQRVAELVSRLREANESNILLMRNSLDVVRDSIRELRSAVGPGDIYTRTGRPRLGTASNLVVDCHA